MERSREDPPREVGCVDVRRLTSVCVRSWLFVFCVGHLDCAILLAPLLRFSGILRLGIDVLEYVCCCILRALLLFVCMPVTIRQYWCVFVLLREICSRVSHGASETGSEKLGVVDS